MPSPTNGPRQAPEAPAAPTAAVVVDGLTTGYDGGAAIEEISFVAARGDMVGLIGPNGSGKSTLIRALLGLLPAWTGRVRVLGREPERARATVGYMPQAEHVDWTFPITAQEVVAMGLYRPRLGRDLVRLFMGGRSPKVSAAMERTGTADLASEQIRELSAGQQRRVLLARTLVKDPDVFLLDEPTAGLDVSVEEDMLQLFAELAAAGKTLIVATHDLGCVYRRYSSALCINRRLLAFGPPSSVLTENVLTEAFGRHVLVFQIGEQMYAMEPHVDHATHET